jgi:hypothetical protein
MSESGPSTYWSRQSILHWTGACTDYIDFVNECWLSGRRSMQRSGLPVDGSSLPCMGTGLPAIEKLTPGTDCPSMPNRGEGITRYREARTRSGLPVGGSSFTQWGEGIARDREARSRGRGLFGVYLAFVMHRWSYWISLLFSCGEIIQFYKLRTFPTAEYPYRTWFRQYLVCSI